MSVREKAIVSDKKRTIITTSAHTDMKAPKEVPCVEENRGTMHTHTKVQKFRIFLVICKRDKVTYILTFLTHLSKIFWDLTVEIN